MRLQMRRTVYEDAVGIDPEDVVSWQGYARPITPLPRSKKTEDRSPAHARLSSAATRRALWILPLRRNGNGVDQYLAPSLHACIASVKHQISRQGTDQV